MAESKLSELRTLTARKPAELAGVKLPPQPPWPASTVNWNDYDVPRIWDSLSCLDHEETWEQARSIARQADLLAAQAKDLERLRERLATAWSGGQTPAAAAALAKIDWLAGALRADALAAATTARGVEGVLEAMAAAKRAMQPIANKWLGVTRTDPRAWRSVAAELNDGARQIMISTDAAVRDHRTNIIIPLPTDPKVMPMPLPNPDPQKPAGGGGRTTATTGGLATSMGGAMVPPSGTVPVEVPASAEPDPGPVLSGSPVPGVSSGVPSALPIFPGSQYAPAGGAYVMPGGTGSTGYVLPMQPKPGAAPQGFAPGGGGPTGMMPMPMGGPVQGGASPGGNAYKQGSRTRWEVSQGGPAVIVPGAAPAGRPPDVEPDPDEFREWFTEVAMPWRLADNPAEPAPLVTIRRGPA